MKNNRTTVMKPVNKIWRRTNLVFAVIFIIFSITIGYILFDGWVHSSFCKITKPLVVIMDSAEERHVYKTSTFRNGKTNVDDIENIIKSLPIEIIKESIKGYWTDENRIFNLHPDLIIIHLNTFSGKESTKHMESHVKFKKFIHKFLPTQTKFIIYSRADNFGSSYGIRKYLICELLELKDPKYNDRIRLLGVKGPVPRNFDDPSTATDLIGLIKEMLKL